MFSPKRYAEELLASVLADWADGFDESTVNIGLWNGGDVQLSNLILKKRVFDIGLGAQISLELGTGNGSAIDDFDEQITRTVS